MNWFRQKNSKEIFSMGDDNPGLEAFVSKILSRYKKAGSVVDGLVVRDHIPNMGSIYSTYSDPLVLPGLFEIPMDDFDGLTGYHYSTSGNNWIISLSEQILHNKEISPLIVAFDDDEGPWILEGATRSEALYCIGVKYFPAKIVIDRDFFDRREDTGNELV